jgi:hypothetical protein
MSRGRTTGEVYQPWPFPRVAVHTKGRDPYVVFCRAITLSLILS